jgi:hypothetical protein
MSLLLKHEFEGEESYSFWCPACKCGHGFTVKGGPPVWGFDGNMQAPTFSPSLRYVDAGCHLYVSGGQIQYCWDCRHDLKGQTIPMVDWDTIIGEEKPMDTNEQAATPPPVTAEANNKPLTGAIDPPVMPPPVPSVSAVTNAPAPPSPAVQRVMNEGHDQATAEKILSDKASSESVALSTTASKMGILERVKEVFSSPKAPPSPAMKLIIAQGYSTEDAEAIIDASLEDVFLACDPQARMTMVRVIASVLHKI